MEINENLTKLIFQEFDDSIRGTDIYNHDGSMWLIFTEERKWVVEFTKQKTLWYNYKHFNDILILFGMELSEGAEYIKKWYENKFISEDIIENTIQNGVKDVKESVFSGFVGDAIKNGVKNTELKMFLWREVVEDTIQNGVKDVQEIYENSLNSALFEINTIKAIKKGVKDVFDGKMQAYLVNDVIEDGVKEVEYYDGDAEILVNEAIENGVKHIDYSILGSVYQKDHSVTTLDFTSKIENTIENGVKEILSVDCDYNRTTRNVIKNGVKL